MNIFIFKSAIILAILVHSSNVVGLEWGQSEDCGKIEETSDLRTKVPWAAGIFARNSLSKPFEYYITGTIIGPTTILTALGGAFGQPPAPNRKYTIPAPANHIVAVGLTSTQIDLKDPNIQIYEVSYILPYSGYDPQNSQFHFFLFHLKDPLNFTTPYVKPACLPVFLKSFPKALVGINLEARQGGFAEPEGELENVSGTAEVKELWVIPTQLESEEYCENQYLGFYGVKSVNHVYCGKAVEKTNPPVCVSYGTALVIPVHNNRWFIAGILTLHPKAKNETSWCSNNTVYFYGKITAALDWILDNLKCNPTQFACGGDKCIPLDSVCDQKRDCEDGRDENAVYCRARKPCILPGKIFECGTYGPCLKQSLVCNGQLDCPEGEDEDPQLCTQSVTFSVTPSLTLNKLPFAVQTMDEQDKAISSISSWTGISNRDRLRCPHIQKSEGVIIECFDSNNVGIPCGAAFEGTVAKFKCQEHYVSNYRLPTTESKCKDGDWKPFRSFGCEAQCGVLDNNIVQSLVISGQTSSSSQAFPWHAAIFARKNNEFAFICGGSLIEKSALITAAHCVTDGSGTLLSGHNFKIVLGGNSSNFADSEKNMDAQIFGIKNIWIPATYDRRTLQSDISIVQLDRDAKYSKYVRPVCYLIKGSNNVPSPGTLGKVPGYGYTNQQKISEHLLFAQFPVISTTDCVSSLKKAPPLSTFCAGYKNGTSVCQGDSGGGMVFPESSGSGERYVIKGLVSHGEVKIGRLCDPNNYAVFTHVDGYADWIIQKLNGIQIP